MQVRESMFFLAYLWFIYLSFWCLETSSLAGEFRSKFPDPVSTGGLRSTRRRTNSPTPTRRRIKSSRDVGELVLNPIQLIRS